jgi:hypothetical protein
MIFIPFPENEYTAGENQEKRGLTKGRNDAKINRVQEVMHF